MNNKFTDQRGVIEKICSNADVLKITSSKGARRANHYHKTTGHWCLVTEGSITYFERPVGSKDKPQVSKYQKGDIFWTGPMLEHLMLFEDYNYNEFLCFSTGARNQEDYENDLVRLEFDLDNQ